MEQQVIQELGRILAAAYVRLERVRHVAEQPNMAADIQLDEPAETSVHGDGV